MYKKLIKKRTPYALVIKIVFVILTAYSIIQLSNEAKRIEEEKAAHQQSMLDFAEKYINDKYDWDWKVLDGNIYAWDPYTQSCILELNIGNDKIKIDMTGNFGIDGEIEFPAGFTFRTDRNYFILYREYMIKKNNYKVVFTYN